MSTLATFISTLGFKMDGSFEQAMQTMAKRMSSLGSAMEASAKRSYTAQARDMGSYGKAMYSLRDKEYKAAEKAAYFDQKERNAKTKWLQEQQQKLNKPVIGKQQDSHVAAFRKNQAEETRLANVRIAKQSQEALKAAQLKRKQSSLAEEASRKELANMNNFYRQQESEEAKQFARNNKALDRAREQKAKDAAADIRREERIQSERAKAALKYQRVQQQEMSRMHSEALRENARREKEMSKRPWWAGGKGESKGGSGFGMGGIGGIPVMGRTTLGMMAGGFGISELVRQSYQMANYQAKTMPMLEFITNDKTKTPEQNKATAASEKAYLDAEIKRLSLDRISATKGYTQLAGDTFKTLGSQGTRDLFTSIQEVGLVTGRSADDMSRAIKAFSQINMAV